MSALFAVIGNPIEHSRSPLIHQTFAEEVGIELTYERIWAPVGGFSEAVKTFIDRGGRGMNVTVPFKVDAFELADQHTARAQRAMAVNTLDFANPEQILGDNTDGVGLIRDLAFHDVPLTGRRILILGAGGATRGVLAPLLAQKPAEILIANRSPERAYGLVEEFSANQDETTLRGCPITDIDAQPFDLIINATPASLSNSLPPLAANVLGAQSVVYDMAYGAEPTVFARWGAEHGARALDGLGMLVEQAAESFKRWHGIEPPTARIRALLREQIEQ
ncbi:MAG TPA: shikimate dehydrogenase [Halothiobacillaceae bacterium]|nr:shikimate dehydrogenase [Halothiobacillaceae bacterium]